MIRLLLICFSGSAHHRDLHSFPTRRSSDLRRVDQRRDRGGALHRVEQPGLQRHLGGLPARREQQEQAEGGHRDRKSTRLNSSHVDISYAVFCLKKKKKQTNTTNTHTPLAPP